MSSLENLQPVYSLRTKLILACMLITILMVGVTLENTRRLLNNTLEKHTENRSTELAPLLNAALSGRLFERDYATTMEVINQLQSSSSVGFTYIILQDDQSVVFANSSGADINPVLAPDESGKGRLLGDIYHTTSPLTISDHVVGTVRYGFSIAPFITAKNNILSQTLLIAFFQVVLMVTLIGFACYLLTRKINSLVDATKIISSGDYTGRVDIQSNDEIGVLANNFNQMAETIADRMQALSNSEHALFIEKERAEVTLDSIGDAVITTDMLGRIEYLNPVAEHLTGWATMEAAGKKLDGVFRLTIPENNNSSNDPAFLRSGHDQTTLTDRNGKIIPIEHTDAEIQDHDGELIGKVLIFRDVSKAYQLSKKLHYQASHDSLTGLLNRDQFERQLAASLVSVSEMGSEHALCYLDLDHFKVVNDTCGHEAGDELLRQLAVLVKGIIRKGDSLARLGGDEFGILILDCPLEQVRSITDAIRKVVREYIFVWGNQSYQVGVSIGVVSVRADSGTTSDLLSAADVACYLAKEQGRNNVCFSEYNDDQQVRHIGEMHWPSRINSALRDNRFVLHQQKIIPLNNSFVPLIECELLVRMIDEKGELVMPGSFIPAAERYRCMQDIDLWVIHAALSSPEISGPSPTINRFSINISGQSLSSEKFLEYVLHEISVSGVQPWRICFEITETAAIANLTSAMHVVSALKERGCLIALDDFGSGLSSFAYLKNLNIDLLKIDGSFVRDIVDDPADRAIVDSINQVAHVMGIETIAEFVENSETQALLQNMGVDYGQGYGIGKPVPLDHPVTELIAELEFGT